MDVPNSISNLQLLFSEESRIDRNELLSDIHFKQFSTLDYQNSRSSSHSDLTICNENHYSKDLEENLEIILSVFWKRGKLGASYYTCADSEIHLLQDVVDVHPDFNNLKTLISQVKPSQIVTCGGLPDTFIQGLSEAVNEKSDLESESTSVIQDSSKNIIFMSNRRKDLNYESCKRYILGIKFGFEPASLDEEDHILFVHSHIDLNQEAMTISMGILVKYLEKYLPQINLKHEPVQISFISHISLGNLVSMDENTYKALQIFNPIVHPSVYKRTKAGYREGFSLFALFNRCKSKAGTKRMKEIFLNPSKKVEELNERLDTIEFCCKPQHKHIVQNLIDHIKKVESVTAILTNINRTRISVCHWRSLYSSLYNAILVGDICEKHSSQSTLLEKVAKSVTSNIHEVIHYMNQIIDFEESFLKNHFTVRSGVYRNLDLLKQTYAEIPEILAKAANLELEDLPSFVEECSIIYITELGYLLSLPVWKGEGSDVSEYELPNFEVKFIVNNYVHYKTPRCVELDNRLGDSVASITDMESKIMVSLIEFVYSKMSDIIKLVKLIADLDCAIALANVALENNYSRPVISLERKIEIIGGRHPLQELCVDNFVPNDTLFGTEKNFIKIITGPNASGKSIYLKQVALIAFLTHIGSFVPAQKAEICTLDFIHSRIQSTESISMRISSFLLDLKQMSHAIYNSTPRSLIIIDEFGKGTTEIDGLSLLAASLIHFMERESKCPCILLSTHFHSLPKLLPPSPLVNLECMNYLLENDEIIYLHKLKNGVSGSSLTLLAAKTAGLSEDTVQRCLTIQNSKVPLKCNPKLKITKTMKNEIKYMRKIFKLVLEDESENDDVQGNNSCTSVVKDIEEKTGDTNGDISNTEGHSNN